MAEAKKTIKLPECVVEWSLPYERWEARSPQTNHVGFGKTIWFAVVDLADQITEEEKNTKP